MAAKQQWVKITDVREFMTRGVVRKGEHAFTKKCLHWPYCAHCGLMLLKNAATQKMRKQACIQLED